jgi:hypothetical protein
MNSLISLTVVVEERQLAAVVEERQLAVVVDIEVLQDSMDSMDNWETNTRKLLQIRWLHMPRQQR